MPDQKSGQAQITNSGSGGGTGATLASFAAVGSVLAASSCCLPVLPFMMAAGLAGESAFLSAARPYLLGASVLFIVFGFYQTRRARKCQRRPSVISSALQWVSAGFVFLSIFFPQVLANAAASLMTLHRRIRGWFHLGRESTPNSALSRESCGEGDRCRTGGDHSGIGGTASRYFRARLQMMFGVE